MMGSGGMVVVDDTTCMVDFARFFLTFTAEESCGKCVPCRVGTRRMLEILERICAGEGEPDDIDRLERLADDIIEGSLCQLGGSAPNPVLTTIRYFRDEIEAHVVDKRCPAKVCRPLIRYTISKDECTGCHACYTACPVDAICGRAQEAAQDRPEDVHQVRHLPPGLQLRRRRRWTPAAADDPRWPEGGPS